MDPTNPILEKAGRETGYKVPDNYFNDVRRRIIADLPEYRVQEQPKLSIWKRIQPYVYMAAMFAGIWCMMKMFHMMTTTDLSLDNPPEAVAIAMADADHYEWMATDKTDTFLLEEDLSGQYTSIEDFKNDFDNSDI